MSVTLYRRREVRGSISNSNEIQSSGNVCVKKALKYRPEKRLTTDWAPTEKQHKNTHTHKKKKKRKKKKKKGEK